MKVGRYWTLLVAVLIGTFCILGFFGREVYRQAPPIPLVFKSTSGEILLTQEDILNGQIVWQSTGGQQVGSVWGHGAYQAPDWTADWLHREVIGYQNILSNKFFAKNRDQLDSKELSIVKDQTLKDYRINSYNKIDGSVTLSDERVQAIKEVQQHYRGLLGGDPALQPLRQNYAIQEDILKSDNQRLKFSQFIFWTAWASSTQRPGENFTYTNNWPHEPLVDNNVTVNSIFWSIISIFLLLFGVGALVWYNSFKKRDDENLDFPSSDPMSSIVITDSMRALWKYVFVISGLFLTQVMLGAVLAHYTVEGQDFYGFPLSKFFPYSIVRTWHIQTALFWIATSFLTTGLFLAPIINGGKDPKGQLLGVNVLFAALLVVVVGSLTGELLAIHHLLDLDLSFYFGHQGYEYTDLGRIWQIALLIGLLLWLALMLRGIVPALKTTDKGKHMLALFTGAATAIGLFYTAGLFYGAKTHISIMEYWRWWVVHLWVEGFFEVFATAALGFVFLKLRLVRVESVTKNTLLATSIFLVGGIPGTFHHLYFSGTPTAITAIGACFSALEVVPLVLIGIEAFETYKMRQLTSWAQNYKWPIVFFVGVAFWNLVGAGLFGFLINPPVALYYMQGLNTTAVHAHSATFGVYGLLSLGLVLLTVRKLTEGKNWNNSILKYSFVCLNLGLGLMVLLSLLPIGLIQTWASVEVGLWYARSADLLQMPIMITLRWMRMVGDTIFIIGTLLYVYFIVGLKTGWSYISKPV